MARPPYSGFRLTRPLAAQNGGRATAKIKRGGRQETAPDVLPLLLHGMELQKKGSLGLAAEAYQSVLAKHPNNPDALHLLGTVAMAAGEVDAAVDYYKRAVAVKSTNPAIHVNLGNALLEKDETAAAEFHLRKALKLHPDLPAALCSLASCRVAAGDHEAARQIYKDILVRIPDLAQALIGYGDLCQTLGEIETARTLYRRAISLKVSPALALASLALCERLPKDSPEATEITRFLREPGLPPSQYLNLSYAAASIADAAGDYDDAFAHFLHAKELSPAKFDIDAHRQELATFKGLFTKQFFEMRAKYGHPSGRPVFVIGMPRSGTTLTEQIISRHPEAAAAGELRDIGRLAGSLRQRGDDARDQVKRLTKLTQAEVKELARRYLATVDRVSVTARRVTDKMPQNFLNLGFIAMLFPNAKIVHCRRDPLDTCLSCFTMHLKDHTHGYAGDLGTLGSYYREYDALMTHWREVLPVPIHELKYERLIDAPEEESRKLIEFVGLPWDPACLTPNESNRPVRTLSRNQVRQPIYRTSVGRWRRYEKHLGPLKEALGDLVAQ